MPGSVMLRGLEGVKGNAPTLYPGAGMAGRMTFYADVRQRILRSRKFAEDVQEAFRGEGAVSVRKQITQRQNSTASA